MKTKKALIVLLRILLMIVLAVVIAVSVWLLADTPAVGGQTIDQQETCPDGVDGWIKIQPVSGYEYIYTAPEGLLVAETCWKAGTTIEYQVIDPPQKTVTIVSTVQQELSHVAVRLVDPADPTATPSPSPSPSVTPSPSPTPSPTPTGTGTPDPTGTPTDPNDPTGTPTVTSTPPPRNTPTPTDQPSGGTAPSGGTWIVVIGIILIILVSLLIIFTG